MLNRLTSTLKNLVVSTIISALAFIMGIVLIPVMTVFATMLATISGIALVYFGYHLIRYIIANRPEKRERNVRITRDWKDWIAPLTLAGVIIIILMLLLRGCGNSTKSNNIDVLNVKTFNAQVANVGTQNTNTSNVVTENVETENVDTSNVETQNVTNQDVETSNVTEQEVAHQDVIEQDVETSNVTEQVVISQQVTTLEIGEEREEEEEPEEEYSEPTHECSVSNTNKLDATCTEDGKVEETCSCGTVLSTKTISATGHTWDNGKVTTQATENNTGVKTYTCTKCHDTKTETIPKIGHTHKTAKTDTKDATCTTDGYTKELCSCGKVISEVKTSATGHSWNNGKVTTQATESSKGVKTYTCTKCNATTTESLDKIPHTHKVADTQTKKATCTTGGYTKEICSCGKVMSETEISATGHSWDNGKVTTKATEESTGVKTFTCTTCKETKTEKIEKLAHTHKVADSKTEKATCTKTGCVKEICSCGKIMSETEISATGHSWDNGKVTTKATEDTTGVKTFTCTTCKETKTEKIAKLTHTHKVADTKTEKATCTEEGYVREVCSCGKVISETEIDATGHSWNKGEVTREATENRTGVMTYTCKRCDETKTEKIDKLEHECKVDDEIEIEATCTTKGKIKYVCSCGEVLDTETTPKLGHDYEIVSEKAPTSTKDGYTKYECNNCGDSYKETIPATGEEDEEEEPEEPSDVRLSANSFVISDGKTVKVTTTGKASDLRLQQSMDQLKMTKISDTQVELTVKTPGVGGTVSVYDVNTGASIEITIEFIYD